MSSLEIEALAKAYDIAARIKVSRNARRAMLVDMMLGDPRRTEEADRQWVRDNAGRFVPPSLSIAKEALAFWEEWTGTRFIQPLAAALPGWGLRQCRQFVADGGDWDCM